MLGKIRSERLEVKRFCSFLDIAARHRRNLPNWVFAFYSKLGRMGSHLSKCDPLWRWEGRGNRFPFAGLVAFFTCLGSFSIVANDLDEH